MLGVLPLRQGISSPTGKMEWRKLAGELVEKIRSYRTQTDDWKIVKDTVSVVKLCPLCICSLEDARRAWLYTVFLIECLGSMNVYNLLGGSMVVYTSLGRMLVENATFTISY